MRSLLNLLALMCMLGTLSAQTEKETFKTASVAFKSNYNKGTYDSIFATFSVDMKNALPLDKTKDFLGGLKTQAGAITNMEFIKFQPPYTSYKTRFERGLFTLNISLDNNDKINGLFIKPFAADNLPTIKRNATKISLPFKGAWKVIWGGDTKELNYHVESQAQKNAFDIVMTDAKGRSYKTDGKTNEDYYAFGQQLFAPCDGEIVLVIDGVKDNKPGEMNAFNTGGNMVILKTVNNEYLVFCHFKHQSVKVKEGKKIKQGQALGLCGNTGNSSEPHLHFHIQNTEDMNAATGVKCHFDKLIVNGEIKQDYSPVKGDVIKREFMN